LALYSGVWTLRFFVSLMILGFPGCQTILNFCLKSGVHFRPQEKRDRKGRNSNPHHWDRGSFGDEVYARIDILPFCVEDGLVDRYVFSKWCMMNLDIDLLQQFSHSSACCISISPKPRRLWLEWGSGEAPRCTTFMGTEYWNHVYPNLPEGQRPKFAPSATGGRMFWWRK